MTSPAKDMQEYLVANGHGVSGTDLFYHKIPGEKTGVVIRDTGGFDTDKSLDRSESIVRPTIQIFARGEKYLYDEIYSRLYGIVDFLDQTHEITINSKRYISIFKAGDILDLGENTSEQPELSVNFYIELVVLIPSLTSATIPASGETISLLFSENVYIGSGGNTEWTLSAPTTAMTYSSGDETDTLIYGLGSTISSSDAPTISYVQPGNGIENFMGKDLESIVEHSVVNNSVAGGGPSDGWRYFNINGTEPSFDSFDVSWPPEFTDPARDLVLSVYDPNGPPSSPTCSTLFKFTGEVGERYSVTVTLNKPYGEEGEEQVGLTLSASETPIDPPEQLAQGVFPYDSATLTLITDATPYTYMYCIWTVNTLAYSDPPEMVEFDIQPYEALPSPTIGWRNFNVDGADPTFVSEGSTPAFFWPGPGDDLALSTNYPATAGCYTIYSFDGVAGERYSVSVTLNTVLENLIQVVLGAFETPTSVGVVIGMELMGPTDTITIPITDPTPYTDVRFYILLAQGVEPQPLMTEFDIQRL